MSARASGEHVSLETEIPVEGEHISPIVHTEEHISAGRGQGCVRGNEPLPLTPAGVLLFTVEPASFMLKLM